jgi:putative ABC transport system permease protein
MLELLSDCRIAARRLLKARGFTSVVILTLTIGITLAAAVVSVVNGYLLQSLPYPAGNRLFSVRFEPGQREPEGLERRDWSSIADIVDYPIAWDLDVFYLKSGEYPEAAPGAWITPGFMQGLGIKTEMGRLFTEDEFKAGSPQVALISHSLWKDRFASDPQILGRHFNAYVSDRPDESESFTVVGVLPANFWHVNPYTQIFTPLRAPTYPYMVRLRSGISRDVAEGRIADLVQARVHLNSVHEEYVRTVRPILTGVSVSAAIVLLIASANVAFLILIRASRQQKDVAIRLALGAGHGRVARLLIAESLILCASATILGTLLASLLLGSVAPIVQQQLGRPAPGGVAALSINGSVIAIVGALSIVIASLLSLGPLVVARRQSLSAMMRRGKQSGADNTGGRRARSLLIVLEVAGSLALLIGCTLMVRTMIRVLNSEMGIRAGRVIAAGIAMRERSYPDEATRARFYDRLLERFDRTEGIQSVGLSNWPVLAAPPARKLESTSSSLIGVTPGYFATFEIPVREGRLFTNADRQGSELVAVVSETLAKRLWPQGGAIGQTIRAADDNAPPVARTVVGVVRDVRQTPTDEDQADLYYPLLQSPGRFATLYVRAAPSPVSTSVLHRVIEEIDPGVTLNPAREVESMAADQFIRPRFLTSLLSAFAVLAAALALIGIYGVIAYSVKQREHEIAVRIAVGADGRKITRLFMKEGAILVAAGIAFGIAGANALGNILRSELYGVRPDDAATMLAASLSIALAGALAMWWPAHRAASTDPVIALREE